MITSERIFIFEFKVNESAEDALQQIEVLESDVEVADQITILGEEEHDDVLDQIQILRTRRRRKILPPPIE